MHASSLVFVVIIALWVVYLLPDALRRRRRLESARTEDRNSAQMRVLVRRAAEEAAVQRDPDLLPVAALTGGTERAALPPAPPVPAPRDGSDPLPAAGDPRPARGHRAGAPRPGSSGVVRRRRRLVAALVALAAAGWACAALPPVSWVAGAVPSLLLLLVLAALARHGADRGGRADQRVLSGTVAAPGAASPAGAEPPVDVVPGEVLGAAPGTAREARPAPAAEATGEADADPAPAVADGQWQPVPVPLPTYLLKPRAPAVGVPALARRRAVVDLRPFDQDLTAEAPVERRVASR